MKPIKGNKIFDKKIPTYRLPAKWGEVLGEVPKGGVWIIYGREKNGKTTLALMLSEVFTALQDGGNTQAPVRTYDPGVLYISGEEGVGADFREAMKRAGVPKKTRVKYHDYVTLAEVEVYLQGPRREKIVFLDNATVYHQELMYGGMLRFDRFCKKEKIIAVVLAHEENNEPHPKTALTCKKLAQRIIHVEGLKATIGGRCPGGEVVIDETKAALIWGDNIKQTSNQ